MIKIMLENYVKRYKNPKTSHVLILLGLLYSFPFNCQGAIGSGPGGIFISQIESNGSTVTMRPTLNFIGSSVSCVDNAGNIRTDCTFSSGGGNSGTVSYGAIYNSSTPVAVSLNSTPSKLSVFQINDISANTTPQASSGQILVMTSAVFSVFANIISTSSGVRNDYFWLAVNGSTQPIFCNDSPSDRCVMGGNLNLVAGSTVSIYGSSSGSGSITVSAAQLSLISGSGGGGGSGITSVIAGTGLSGGGSAGAVTLSLSPNSTSYIQNTGTPSIATQVFSVSSGTVTGSFIDYQGSLQTVLMPSATEALRLVNTSSHTVFMVIQTSGTVYWKVGSDITNLRIPEFDIYNATTGVKDIAISTNDVMNINAIEAFPSLTANYPLQLNASKQVVTQLIDLTSDVTNTLPSTNLPSNVVYTNVQQTISASKVFTATQSFNAGVTVSSVVVTGLASGQCVQTGTNGLLTVTGSACGSGGGGGSPGGSPTNIQFNNSGSFGGSSNLQWDNTNSSMTINGNLGLGTTLNLNDPSQTQDLISLNFNGVSQTVLTQTNVPSGFAIYASTKGDTSLSERIFIDSQKGNNQYFGNHYFYNADGTKTLAVFDGQLNRSSFTSTVVLSSTVMDGSNSVGNSGQVLTSRGAGLAPTWQNSSGGGGVSVYPATSTITFAGPPYPLQLLDIKAASWVPQISNGSLPPGQFEITSSSVEYVAMVFQAGTTQYAQFDAEMPGWYVSGSTLTFKIVSTATMTVTENWEMDAQCVPSGGIPGSWGTPVTVTTGTVNNRFTLSQESAALTPSGSCAPYQHLWIRIYRNGDPVGDAYFIDALVYEEKNSVSAQ